MKAMLATGVFGALVIALLAEVMNVVETFSVMHHVATYNAWMTI